MPNPYQTHRTQPAPCREGSLGDAQGEFCYFWRGVVVVAICVVHDPPLSLSRL